MAKRQIVIPINVDESYQETLIERLGEYGITQHEVAREMGISDSAFSRWVARPSSDTGRPMSIQLHNVIKIEKAIIAIRARREREAKRKG